MTTNSVQHGGKRARFVQAIKRIFRGKPQAEDEMPEAAAAARMSLALAIAEQYVLMSQACPLEQSESADTLCGSKLEASPACSSTRSYFDRDDATLAAPSEGHHLRKSLLLMVRPRTCTGSTLDNNKGYVFESHTNVYRNPICC
ncbi:hypothetical protein LPJ78_000232 [Coemansia sp. RSA 989]|nr:hypothetical protein LPJ79_000997 [Coemansia sp. RSA 1821]KAJ1868294.1 hypothetical protein LPJ78_000232 [Coemansia sp. RSA 989]KAJ1875595.1 hypothetical protein LPJ55_000588 [Coemansia sp. RSA 990]KAJ2673121.1 hypothetical protein IWW42_002406 [Coemansia sp. RSA 1085]